MAKAKLKATIMAADGVGGMARVQDRRFESGDWPTRFEVPREQSDTWMRYFYAECARRGWSSTGFVQLEARENSGSITVNTGGSGGPQLAVVWEKRRDGPIKVRARSVGTQEFVLSVAQELFDQINNRCRAGVTERFYRRGQLEYQGWAWRSEVWLDDTLRLGPPSQQYETALLGPRVIIVDALVDCVGPGDAPFVFDQTLRELAAFLTVVTGMVVRLPEQGQKWTATIGAADCAVRSLGYFETDSPQQMPMRGSCRSVPLKPVSRPDFSRGEIVVGSTNEQELPADIIDLWTSYRALNPNQRRDFLQAAAKWQEALLHWAERSTLSFALMVVACEALKPSCPRFKDHNIYQVVEALLGKQHAERLRERGFRAQDVRSAHLHRGEFHGSEFVQAAITSSYYDPTFTQTRDELAQITRAAIIEWLRRRGIFTMLPLQRKRSMRRWVREHALIILPVVTFGGVVAGLALDQLLRVFWHG